MGTVWDPIADGSEIVGILSSSRRSGRRSARNSYTSQQRRAPSSSGGSFFAHVKSALSWTLGLGIGAALLVGLGVGGLQLHRLATTSEFFAIKRVEIRGTTHFSREEVLKAANLQSGVNSLTVNIADVEQGLRSNPWVLSVAVKRRLPDAFEIRIRERIPAFWMLKDGVLHYAENKGQIIAPVSVGNFLSLPTLEILPGGEELLPQMDELSRAFQAAAQTENHICIFHDFILFQFIYSLEGCFTGEQDIINLYNTVLCCFIQIFLCCVDRNFITDDNSLCTIGRAYLVDFLVSIFTCGIA